MKGEYRVITPKPTPLPQYVVILENQEVTQLKQELRWLLYEYGGDEIQNCCPKLCAFRAFLLNGPFTEVEISE